MEKYCLLVVCYSGKRVRTCLLGWISVLYHSFLRYSVEGSDRCGYLKEVKGHGYDETLPLGLKLTVKFHYTTEWIILRHGPGAWLVEIVSERFRRGWPEFHSAVLTKHISCEFTSRLTRLMVSEPNRTAQNLTRPVLAMPTSKRPAPAVANVLNYREFYYI